MAKLQSTLTAALFMLGNVGAANAGDCAVEYIRTACPGQETESYSKCGGKQSCVKNENAATAEACKAVAVKACANDRLKITKSKVVHAKFDGKDVMSASGNKDFCADYANRATEFDQCAK